MSKAPDRQVTQMVNFIMQEAHEKANEIRIKTEHDFNLEKQNLVHSGKQKVAEEYAQKEKDLEIQLRISRSTAVSAARVKKMKARDDLLVQLTKESLEKLATYTKNPEYPNLMKKLIIQGLIKIEEPVVEILARSEDKPIVSRVLSEAVSEYKSIMAAAGHTVTPKVSVSDTDLPAKACVGGVILSALNGRIILNQTLDERLSIAYHDLLPSVRKGLFP